MPRRFRCFRSASLLVVATAIAAAQSITNVENGASNLSQGLPNAGIAQGSIFIVLGSGLGPSTAVTAPAGAAFQTTSLSGTSVSVTVGSTTVSALMYYTSDAQVTALLPSSTPTGAGTLTVTYNGNASAAFNISVVANSAGIFTISENGQGVAIVTNTDYSLVSAIPGTGSLADTCTGGQVCPYTYAGAANPGDTLTIWATGLGPISGDDASGAGLGQNMPNLPLTVWIGGVQATVTYQGRSGCCIGEDQVAFIVPSNVPTGCAVPLAIEIAGTIGNYTAIPVANGSRSCTMSDTAFNAAAVSTLTTNTGTIHYASMQLGREIGAVSSSGITYEDYGVGTFAQITVSPTNQPTVLTSLDNPPYGTCTTYSSSAASGQPLLNLTGGLDAGAITVTGPSGPVSMVERQGTPTTYSADFSPNVLFFSGGKYTMTAAGGKDISKFNTTFTITSTPTWQNSDQNRLLSGGITRSSGLTLNWVGGSSNYYVQIFGNSASDNTGVTNAGFSCLVPSTPNTFTVPANVLLALPPGPYGEVDFRPVLPPQSFSATGLDVGVLLFHYDTSLFVTFN